MLMFENIEPCLKGSNKSKETPEELSLSNIWILSNTLGVELLTIFEKKLHRRCLVGFHRRCLVGFQMFGRVPSLTGLFYTNFFYEISSNLKIR